ncbi:MAG: hypothetical protein IJK98_06635, partial [Clostridia bacterium]|nr:hypothetical protein [Clostridia bacterium]
VCAAPYRLTIDRRHLRAGENELTLKIADLAATAYAQTDPERYYEKQYIGPYHAPALAFEKAVPGGGFSGLSLRGIEF